MAMAMVAGAGCLCCACAYAVGGAAVFSLGKGWNGTWDERREDFEARVSLGLTRDRTRDRTRRGILCARRGFGV